MVSGHMGGKAMTLVGVVEQELSSLLLTWRGFQGCECALAGVPGDAIGP